MPEAAETPAGQLTRRIPMRVRVDLELCQGHTMCAMTAPQVFLLSEEDGRAHVPEPEVPEDLEAAVVKAAGRCPERAVVVD